jgi:hypothetical protein
MTDTCREPEGRAFQPLYPLGGLESLPSVEVATR